jgi:hypothetical protein
MNRSKIENSLQELNNLVLSSSLLEAFDKDYQNNVSRQENRLPTNCIIVEKLFIATKTSIN